MKQNVKPLINNKIANNFIYYVASNIIKKSFRSSRKKRGYDYRDTDIVYHYTSFNSFYKIIETESLIASNALYLNDKHEFRTSIKAFEFSLGGILLNKKASKLTKSIIKSILEQIGSLKISDNYVTCFSAEKDLLSQWIAYGDRGNGVAIGFDINELDGCFQYIGDGGWIDYDSHKMLKDVDLVNYEFFNEYSKLVRRTQFENVQQQVDLACEIYLQHLIIDFLSHYKHSSFSEEKEYRIALRNGEGIPGPLSIEFMPKDKSLIVPFTKFTLAFRFNKDAEDELIEGHRSADIPTKAMTNLPIKEIVLGPCVDKLFSEPGLRMFLDSNGYGNIKIVGSNIPLRNL